ncbi:MAG: response regulator [Hyphomicrobiaceae bacterium]
MTDTVPPSSDTSGEENVAANVRPQPDPATRVLTGEDQISWNPNMPVPAGIFVENLRRRGIDQLEFTIPHREHTLRGFFSLDRFRKQQPRVATITFAEDHTLFVIPATRGSKPEETLVERKEITGIHMRSRGPLMGSLLQILIGETELTVGAGLPKPALNWLRDRLLLETAGLVSRPVFNIGRRVTRKTSNPDDDFYTFWPVGPNRLLSLFLDETPEQAKLLRTSIENEDWELAASQCHWFKSGTAAVGAAQLSELCQRIEIKVVTRDYADIETLLGHFDRELERVTGTLCNIVNGDPADGAPERSDPSGRGRSVAPDLKGAKILLVEDSLVNQEVACLSLDDAGCDTTIASDGEAAIEWFGKDSFDLILMDCQMPGVDGFEATRIIREIESINLLPRTPIIALTANALKDDRNACLSAGMNDYLSKPYEEQEIFELLLKWLQHIAYKDDQEQSVPAE